MTKILQKTKIDILGSTWIIEETDKSGDSFGDTTTHTRTIQIFNSAHIDTVQPIASTKLHECMHAILKQSGTSELLNEQFEEAIITAIEIGLYPLIQLGLFNEKTKKEKSKTKSKSKRRSRRSRKSS